MLRGTLLRDPEFYVGEAPFRLPLVFGEILVGSSGDSELSTLSRFRSQVCLVLVTVGVSGKQHSAT